jgi:hypothetical protein
MSWGKMRIIKDPILAMAEAQVQEAEERVSRQAKIVSRLEADGFRDTAQRARELMASFNDTLQIARRHLDIERQIHRIRIPGVSIAETQSSRPA